MKYILFFILLTVRYELNSQSNAVEIIGSDHLATDVAFNNNIFATLGTDGKNIAKFFDIISVDSTNIYIKTVNKTQFILIKVKIIFNTGFPTKLITKGREFEYYLLDDYKLFGFYFSDMNLFVKVYGYQALKVVGSRLVDAKILTLKEKRWFLKSFRKKASMYYSKVAKPCELLRSYFLNSCPSSILLPVQPLIPLRI